jgi:hypothetical protein
MAARPDFLSKLYTRLYAACIYDPFEILPRVGEVIQIVERQDPKFLVLMFPFWLGLMLLLFPVTLVMTGFVGTIQSIWESVVTAKTETKAKAPENSRGNKREEKLQETTSKKEHPAANTPQENHNHDNRNPFHNPLKGEWGGLLVKKKTEKSS